MKFIELNLRKLDDEAVGLLTISEAIEKSNICVILGSPGSGKTTICQSYAIGKPNTTFTSIYKFLRQKEKIPENTEILLLDGLDEYRSSGLNGKSYVIFELAEKIGELQNEKSVRIVICCRQMDWYGEHDTKALRDELNREVGIYNICPLSQEQQLELAILQKIPNPETFIEKFEATGLLSNPQMFNMLKELYVDDPSYVTKPKIQVYHDFIARAKEQNEFHKINDSEKLSSSEIEQFAGYISFFYFFSDVPEINEEIISEISNDKQGIPQAKLLRVVRTKLFDSGGFIHRSIAEFACAAYLYNHRIRVNQFSENRIRGLFVRKNRVPTELRGIYSWICSMSGDMNFLKVDPYYQIIHGDCSTFSIEKKIAIVRAVKTYALKNPYFFNFYEKSGVENFYETGMDDFLINEFAETTELKNHYGYFLCLIIASASSPSEKLRKYVEERIFDKKVSIHLKSYLIRPQLLDKATMLRTLDAILDGSIADTDDSLKDVILNHLYPHIIEPRDVTKYLFSYNNKTVGHCYFLYLTPFEEKFGLVKKILELSKPVNNHDYPNIPKNCESFIEDFFLELVLSYPEKFTAPEIYSHLNSYLNFFGLFQAITFRSYRYDLNREEIKRERELTKLSNELFSLFLDDVLKSDKPRWEFPNYSRLTGFKPPDNKLQILKEKLDKNLNNEKLSALLILIYQEMPPEDRDVEIREYASRYGVRDEVEKWLNPPKIELESQIEERRAEREKARLKDVAENEAYLQGKKDEEILNDFRVINFVAKILLLSSEPRYENSFTENTFNTILRIMKTIPFSNPTWAEGMNLAVLAKEAPEGRRILDIVYYVSICLNNPSDFERLKEDEFKKYLYIISLGLAYSMNARKGDYIAWFEESHPVLARSALVEFLKRIIEHRFMNHAARLIVLIQTEEDIDSLKRLLVIYSTPEKSIENKLIQNFLEGYNFGLDEPTLKEILQFPQLDADNKKATNALIAFYNEDDSCISTEIALTLFSLLRGQGLRHDLHRLTQEKRVLFLHYLMRAYTIADQLEHTDGIQTLSMQGSQFLRHEALNSLELVELERLLDLHSDDADIWKPLLLNAVAEKSQNQANALHNRFSIERARNFLHDSDILNQEDFFIDLKDKISQIISEIEENRNNEIDVYFKPDSSPRIEEFCRDRFLEKLNDKFGFTLDCTKEKNEGNNRVDINVKYRANQQYQVQIECKTEMHRELFNAVNDQLIEKYIKKHTAPNGVYLVFNFGRSGKSEEIEKQIIDKIPTAYRDRISVMLINFPLKNP